MTSYSILVSIIIGAPYFSEGTNTTVWSEIRTGSNVSLKCTVHNSLPPVTELEMIPHAGNKSNWIIKRNGTHSIEMVITNATSKMNTMDITCSAGNGIRTALLVYQTFVGGKFMIVKILENVVNEFSGAHECHFSLINKLLCSSEFNCLILIYTISSFHFNKIHDLLRSS